MYNRLDLLNILLFEPKLNKNDKNWKIATENWSSKSEWLGSLKSTLVSYGMDSNHCERQQYQTEREMLDSFG